MYDKTPVYPHQQHLPCAHEPLKSIYVFQRLLTTVLLVPFWLIYYSILPRSFRPRPSWSITQIIVVKFTKRIYKVTEVAGVTWGTRDPTQEPDTKSLSETRFAWVPPLPDELCTGIVNDDQVPRQRVGTFIWPMVLPPSARLRSIISSGGGRLPESRNLEQSVSLFKDIPDGSMTAFSTPAFQYKVPDVRIEEALPYLETAAKDPDVEADAADCPPHVIGLYLHGGGYCHMSAHEKSGTSRVPRRLMKDNLFQEIHAIEYRLLQHAPVPGALQDAAAVYANLVTHHLGAYKSPDGKYRYPEAPTPSHVRSHDAPISPSTLSVGQTLDYETRFGASIPSNIRASPLVEKGHRRHVETIHREDSQRDSVQPQIGGNDATSHSPVNSVHSTQAKPDAVAVARRPRIILIGDSAGGNLVLALARWIRDEGVLPSPDGMLLLSPSCDPCTLRSLVNGPDSLTDLPCLAHTLPQVPASRRPRPHADTDYLLDTPEPRALLSRTFLGHHPIEMVYSPYISPASEWVLSVFHGNEGMVDLEPLGPHKDSRDYRDEGIKTYDCAVNCAPMCPDGRPAANNPYIRGPEGMGLFTDFPRALIVVGDAERLEREVIALERALEHDGARVRMVWAKDAVHDVLIMAAWDERVREGIWKEIGKWVGEVVAE